MDGTIANEYRRNNVMIKHYIDQYKPVPLWALFEVLSLGNIGQLMWTLRVEDRRDIAKFFKVYDPQFDSNADFIRQSIYVIRDLRNAIAHNHIIFDCRFKGSNTRISRNIQGTISSKINLSGNYKFNAIIDYLILLLIVLKESGMSKTQLSDYINNFEKSVQKLYEATKLSLNPLPYSIYNMIIGENFKNKLKALKKYISA